MEAAVFRKFKVKICQRNKINQFTNTKGTAPYKDLL